MFQKFFRADGKSFNVSLHLYVQVKILHKLHLVQRACTSCTLLYKLDLKRISVKLTEFFENISYFMCINIQITVRVSHNFSMKNLH